VLDNVFIFFSPQPEIDRNQDRSDLRNCIKGFEHGVCIGRYVSDPVAGEDAHALKRSRPSVAAIKKTGISESFGTIHYRRPAGVKFCGPSGKIKRSEWRFHIKVFAL
jgi:hypothetical protein